MAKIKGAVVVDTERCKGCNLCVVACPLDVLALTTKEVNKRGYTFAQTVLEIMEKYAQDFKYKNYKA